MTRGPWMFRSFAGAWIYREVAPGEAEVTFKYYVEARWSLLGLGDGVLAWVFARRMQSRLESLRARLEAMWASESS